MRPGGKKVNGGKPRLALTSLAIIFGYGVDIVSLLKLSGFRDSTTIRSADASLHVDDEHAVLGAFISLWPLNVTRGRSASEALPRRWRRASVEFERVNFKLLNRAAQQIPRVCDDADRKDGLSMTQTKGNISIRYSSVYLICY